MLRMSASMFKLIRWYIWYYTQVRRPGQTLKGQKKRAGKEVLGGIGASGTKTEIEKDATDRCNRQMQQTDATE